MNKWKHKIKIKHLLTESEEYEDIKEIMFKISEIIEFDTHFLNFPMGRFINFPSEHQLEDLEIAPVDYANNLLDKLYDFADENRIWIG